jgi:hypothetical protein
MIVEMSYMLGSSQITPQHPIMLVDQRFSDRPQILTSRGNLLGATGGRKRNKTTWTS